MRAMVLAAVNLFFVTMTNAMIHLRIPVSVVMCVQKYVIVVTVILIYLVHLAVHDNG